MNILNVELNLIHIQVAHLIIYWDFPSQGWIGACGKGQVSGHTLVLQPGSLWVRTSGPPCFTVCWEQTVGTVRSSQGSYEDWVSITENIT
jgi:hypothetical protein